MKTLATHYIAFLKWAALFILISLSSCSIANALVPKHKLVDMRFFERHIPGFDNHALEAIEDSDGFLWVTNSRGLFRFDGRKLHAVHSRSGEGLSGKVILRIIEHDGFLWLASTEGLFSLNLTTYDLKPYSYQADKSDSIAGGNIRYLSVDNQGDLWVSSKSGLSLYRPDTDSFKNYYLEKNGSNDTYAYAFRRVARDKNGGIWATTYNQGLRYLDTVSEKFLLAKDILKDQLGANEYDMLSGKNALDTYTLSNGNVAVVFSNRLIEINHNNEIVKKYLFHSEDDNSTTDYIPRKIYEDTVGTIWLLTNQAGIIRISADRSEVLYTRNSAENPFSIHSDSPYSIYESHNGVIGLLYINNTMQFWSSIDERIEKISMDASGYKNVTDASNIVKSKDGGIWMSSYSTVLSYFNYQKNEFNSYNLPSRILSFTLESEESIWFSSPDGIFNFRPQSSEVIKISDDHSNYISFNKENGLWYFKSDSVHNLNLQTKENRRYLVPGKESLFGMSRGSHPEYGVYLYDDKGFYHYQENGDQFVKQDFVNTVFNRETFTLIVDDTLWAFGKGIMSVDLSLEGGELKLGGIEQKNIPGSSPLLNPIYQDGSFWVQTNEGDRFMHYQISDGSLSVFDVSDGFPRVDKSFLISLIENEELIVSEPGSLYRVPISSLVNPSKNLAYKVRSITIHSAMKRQKIKYNVDEPLILKYEDHAFELNFSDNQFHSYTESGVQYRMLGLNKEWIDSVGTSVPYAGLSHGSYEFQIRTSNENGNIESLKIIVEPPLWLTPWAYSIYSAIILLIASFIGFLIWDKLQLKRRSDNEIRLYAQSFEDAAEGFCVIDESLNICLSNTAFRTLLGSGWEKFSQLLPNDRPIQEYSDIWEILHKKGKWEGCLWLKGPSGSNLPLECKSSLVSQHHTRGQPNNKYMLVLTDISQRLLHEQELKKLANFDSLTGLPNRHNLETTLKKLTEESKSNAPFHVLFMDVDRFKQVNDSLSHHVGDCLLIELADRCKAVVEKKGFTTRMGGDEFVVIITEIKSKNDLETLCQQLIDEVEKPIKVAENLLYVSLSIGISAYPSQANSADKLLQFSDAAMYASKAKGGGCFSHFSENMDTDVFNAMQLEANMREGINKEEFLPHFQAKVDMSNGSLVGFEALARWLNPEQGTILPGVFIDTAERTGIILKIGAQILSLSCQQLQRWTSLGFSGFTMAVNISAQQLAQADFVEQVATITKQYDVNPKSLEFEITESILMNDIQDSVAKLTQLQNLGIRICVDDFGTGYSSLSYLSELPIDVLKIDQSFVKNMFRDRRQANIVKTILELAKNLELEVVAEGVEDRESHDYLFAMGCNIGQGYWYYQPMVAEEVERLDVFKRKQRRTGSVTS